MLYGPELGIYIPVLDFCARSRRVSTKKHGPQTSPDRDLYTLGIDLFSATVPAHFSLNSSRSALSKFLDADDGPMDDGESLVPAPKMP